MKKQKKESAPDKYPIRFDITRMMPEPFRQKEAEIMKTVIAGCRVGAYIAFECYGTIGFAPDDILLTRPTVTCLDKFSRSNTDCLVYTVKKGNEADGVYDRLFIYQSGSKAEQSYGFVISGKGGQVHKYCITHELCDLTASVIKVIHNIPFCRHMNEYLKEHRSKMIYRPQLTAV